MDTPGSYDREALQTFLVELGLALGSGDLEAITDRFDFPALLTLPDRSVELLGPREAHDALASNLLPARREEVVAVVPEITSVAEVGWSLLWVSVRWSHRDEYAGVTATEQACYLLRRGRDIFEICVVAPVTE